MFRACGRCGKIHPYNTPCPNPYRVYAGGDERRQRSLYSWTKKSKQLRADTLFCEVCKEQGRYTYDDIEVHHIVKLRDQGDLLDDGNLICLCREHHRQADSGEISQDYLKALAKKRIEESGE